MNITAKIAFLAIYAMRRGAILGIVILRYQCFAVNLHIQ